MNKLTKKQQRAIDNIRKHRERCAINSMTFAPCLPAQKVALEKFIGNAFAQWWECWIEPQLEILEGKEGA